MKGLESEISHISELDGLCDGRQAHGADRIGTLADAAGAIQAEEVMAARNQGSNHLVLQTLDTDLLAPHHRSQAWAIGEERLGRRGRGGAAFPGGREGGAVRRKPVGVQVSRRAGWTSADALGLGMLQGFAPRDDGGKTGGPGLTGLQIDDRNLRHLRAGQWTAAEATRRRPPFRPVTHMRISPTCDWRASKAWRV